VSPPPPVRVLIADDDAILREIARAMLENSGFEVETAASGDAALKASATRLPDIALLDVEMQDGNGYQACRNIRALPGGADLPIVMVTGLDDSSSIDRAYEAGATDFVVKPINWALLAHRMRYVLRGARTIDALRFSAERIHRLAYFDSLTGLPNREWIREYLAQSILEAAERQRCVTLLYIDLDQFKRINDTLGLATGDGVLCQTAERLRTALAEIRGGDPEGEPSQSARLDAAAGSLRGQLARVGGDEFLVVFAGDTGIRHAEHAAKRILSLLSAPCMQESNPLVVTPSIGISVYPDHGSDAQSLLKNADAAMSEAKTNGRNQSRIFDSAVSARAMKRLSLEMELRRAIENSSLEVYYQPKYHARSLRFLGGEALLRWFHPERGQIPTGDFIAVAEETGLIGDIGRWAMKRVCRDLCDWRAAGFAPPNVAVNVSGRDFMHPESLLNLCDTVSRAGLDPSLFEIELTEGVLMQDAEAGRRSLLALKEFGFALAIDDFGTGYCSLNYLKRFPLDTLKIDRSFVADISTDPDDAAIVRAIVALGHSLELRIVAEGVSTQAQLQFLQGVECDAIQGFLMSPAIPASAFRELLARPDTAGAIEIARARRIAR